jgi:hypothetical protein
VTWTRRNSGTANELLGVAYGDGRFIAVGGNLFDRTPTGWLLTSEDGVSWTTITPAAVRSALGAITHAGDRFVAVGGGLRGLGHFNVSLTTIVGSTDGLSWTDHSPLTVDTWLMGVAYHNRHFVAAGLSGTVLQSLEVPEASP